MTSRPGRHAIAGTALTLAVALGCANTTDGSDTSTTSDTSTSTSTTAATSTDLSTTVAPSAGPVDLASITVRLTTVATLDQPTSVVPRPNSTSLYATEKAGTIRRLTPNGNGFDVADQAVLDITDDVGDAGGERGLLGMAFAPDGSAVYVNYTDGSDDGATVIARWAMTIAGGAEVAKPSTREEILRVDQPFPNHNGGNLTFGPDGYLYVGFGDGGSQGDPSDHGQNPDTLLASMIRIDPSKPDGRRLYSIPPDNPFADGTRGRPEVFAYGLRNPWRFSFDRANGDLWIGDVGAFQWEEIDLLPASTGGGNGANLGWSLREGRHDTDKPGDRPTDLVEPIFEYSHDDGSSVTGGFVYRGTAIPKLSGVYLFSDFAKSTLRALVAVDGSLTTSGVVTTVGDELTSAASFGQDLDGELYVVSLDGPILRIASA